MPSQILEHCSVTRLHSSEPTATLPTLPSYLQAARKILSLILQIPPVDPSTSLRTAYLLHLTNDVLNSIPGYTAHTEDIPELLDWLDDLDQAWLSVLQSQVWDPEQGTGVDLVLTSDDVAKGLKSSPVNQTEQTRLRSLLVGGAANIEQWLAVLGKQLDGDADVGADVESILERLGVQEGFDELFSRTLQELGGMSDLVLAPM